MKKILLTVTLLVAFAQAENIVHYDKKEIKKSGIKKPNHPNSDLYGKK